MLRHYPKPLILLASLLFVLSSCKTYSPDTYTEQQLIFGEGGGFTGEVSTYILLDNGRLFKQVGKDKQYELLQKVPGKMYKSVFQKVREMELMQKEFDHPGNLYKFIEIQEGAEKHTITWGDPNHEVDSSIGDLYQTLLSLNSKK